MIKEYILVFLACVILSSISIATAADVEVHAKLSDTTTVVRTPVRLEIVVQGARNAEVPRDLRVEGLQVRYIGESMQFQMVNLQISTSSSYTYMILPLRTGNFTIPPLDVKVDDQAFRTQPISLTVYGPGDEQQSSSPAPLSTPTLPAQGNTQLAADAQAEKSAFGVLVVPKTQIYVGEVVPVEIRYYFHPDLPVQSLDSFPSLIGDDFVVKGDAKPRRESQVIHGVRYIVVSFRNSIRPLKAGELKLPATSISCRVLVQARPPSGTMMDTFFQRFLDPMSGGIAQIQQMKFGSEPVVVHVKPLPEENKPDSFHGAIGQFSLDMEVSPRDPLPGDPVTLRGVISGKGNFDEMGTPDLVSKEGWQFYPPSSKLAISDDSGYAGKKTFEWMLIPKEKKSHTPALEFSYFDTASNRYVTLHGRPLPVDAAPLAGAASATPMPSPVSAVDSTIPSMGRDKFRIARKLRSESFRPVTASTPFVVANGVVLLALLMFLGYQLIRCHAASDRGRKAALRRSLGACRARASTAQGKDFYSSVVECLRLQAEIISGKSTGGYSGDEIVAILGLKGEEAALVLKVFARYEESAYGGAQSALSAETRAAVLMLLNHRK